MHKRSSLVSGQSRERRINSAGSVCISPKYFCCPVCWSNRPWYLFLVAMIWFFLLGTWSSPGRILAGGHRSRSPVPWLMIPVDWVSRRTIYWTPCKGSALAWNFTIWDSIRTSHWIWLLIHKPSKIWHRARVFFDFRRFSFSFFIFSLFPSTFILRAAEKDTSTPSLIIQVNAHEFIFLYKFG